MPAYDQAVPAHLWPLSDAGRAEAARLCASLPAAALLVASDEAKAWQTLAPAGAVLRDFRLAEVARTGEPWDGPFRRMRRQYVCGTDHDGWEPRASVVSRFEAAVEDHLVRAAGRPLVMASHGMAMTVWLTAQRVLSDPGEFWAS